MQAMELLMSKQFGQGGEETPLMCSRMDQLPNQLFLLLLLVTQLPTPETKAEGQVLLAAQVLSGS